MQNIEATAMPSSERTRKIGKRVREKGEGRRERREKGEGRRERREKGEGRREKGEGRREKGEGSSPLCEKTALLSDSAFGVDGGHCAV